MVWKGDTATANLAEYTVEGCLDDSLPAAGLLDGSLKRLPASMKYYAARHPQYDWDELKKDYAKKNAHTWRLVADAFNLPRVPNLWVDPTHAPYCIRFSRVAFNASLNQAIVYSENFYGGYLDRGSYVIFRLEGGVWRVVDGFGGFLS
jgi:hypothetical protein